MLKFSVITASGPCDGKVKLSQLLKILWILQYNSYRIMFLVLDNISYLALFSALTMGGECMERGGDKPECLVEVIPMRSKSNDPKMLSPEAWVKGSGAYVSWALDHVTTCCLLSFTQNARAALSALSSSTTCRCNHTCQVPAFTTISTP
ncbi:hypothetical protein OIU76_001979 [Salix suchowensis]|uniref:Uncharacterized protein n=1 Tax=Salix suchowensis TaxID=1278906 RepID=A0ABQ9CKR4_9ROSI|nr:hypothetical protein OIU76_001979 [Salix suchowensis]KAJ6398818.1 hypothetical protein OIU77_019563 [Salix suchowensis]